MAYLLKLIFPSLTVEFILHSVIMVYTLHTTLKANAVYRFFAPKDTSPLNTSHPSARDLAKAVKPSSFIVQLMDLFELI